MTNQLIVYTKKENIIENLLIDASFEDIFENTVCSSVGVGGTATSAGSYDANYAPGDSRTPKVLGSLIRRIDFSKPKAKKKKSNAKVKK
jgi:hypothetical protein